MRSYGVAPLVLRLKREKNPNARHGHTRVRAYAFPCPVHRRRHYTHLVLMPLCLRMAMCIAVHWTFGISARCQSMRASITTSTFREVWWRTSEAQHLWRENAYNYLLAFVTPDKCTSQPIRWRRVISKDIIKSCPQQMCLLRENTAKYAVAFMTMYMCWHLWLFVGIHDYLLAFMTIC